MYKPSCPGKAIQQGDDNTDILIVCVSGGLLYGLIELVWRGWTHWTMLICGGLCFGLMYLISALCENRLRSLLLCTAAITLVEFCTGCIVNLLLGWDVWDYSDEFGNVLGQICPLFTALWFLLSIPGVALCKRLRWLLNG